jgi:hypothetical protein
MAAARVTLALSEQVHDAVRLWIRKGPQQDSIDDAENRGVCAYPDGERQEGGNGESGRSPKRTKPVTAILDDCVHPTTLLSRMRLDGAHPSERLPQPERPGFRIDNTARRAARIDPVIALTESAGP